VTRRKGAALACLGVLCSAGCAPAALNSLRIDPASTADSLVFWIADATGNGEPPGTIYGLAVVLCSTGAVEWNIAANGTRRLPREVTYGEHPPGFDVRVMPARLSAGCHEAYVSDAPRIRFYVDSKRSVRSTPQPR
jgi:hypothetical protein